MSIRSLSKGLKFRTRTKEDMEFMHNVKEKNKPEFHSIPAFRPFQPTKGNSLAYRFILIGSFPHVTGKKKRLLELFGSWCSDVSTLILETPENMVLRRDIYDRDMINSWGNGRRVTLLGDAAHPMQPNLGQGGCMAIEVKGTTL